MEIKHKKDRKLLMTDNETLGFIFVAYVSVNILKKTKERTKQGHEKCGFA